ncbi:subtilisin-like protein [Auricularia subglabra TFB-10046 SS5]|nr:subtilisin-like protein [Auricularia subglabra TFB-10046 SS5]
MFSLARCTALALAWLSAAQASPDLLPIAAAHLPGRPGGYIVTLKDASVARRDFSSVHRSILSSLSADDSRVRYEWPRLNALAGTFSDAALTTLRSSGDVAAIERDVHGGVAELVTQTDAPWGLQRISQVPRMSSNNDHALNYTYAYDSSAGKDVDIYIVDSGVNVEHDEFEGRARWGTSLNFPRVDAFGHGTHVAGTAAGKRFGVAKAANIISVRVLPDSGNGSVSDAIAGVNWVIEEVTAHTNAPSVINMSLQYPGSDVLDAALAAAVDAGIHVVVAAGNFKKDASNYSPSRSIPATVVGAMNITDEIAWYSNFGPTVDIFAPGDNITSADYSTRDGYILNSGTSMASPHVAGLTAYVIALEGDKPPAEILARIKEWSPDGLLREIPEGTINEVADNGVSLTAQ